MTSNPGQLNPGELSPAQLNPGQLTTAAPVAEAGDDAPERSKQRLLDRACESAPELSGLLRTYYRHVPAEELAADEAGELAGALRAHHALAKTRPSGRPLGPCSPPRPGR